MRAVAVLILLVVPACAGLTDAVMTYSGATSAVTEALQPTLDMVDSRAASANGRISEVAMGLEAAIREAQEAKIAAGEDPELDMNDWLKIAGTALVVTAGGTAAHGQLRNRKYLNKSAASNPTQPSA